MKSKLTFAEQDALGKLPRKSWGPRPYGAREATMNNLIKKGYVETRPLNEYEKLSYLLVIADRLYCVTESGIEAERSVLRGSP